MDAICGVKYGLFCCIISQWGLLSTEDGKPPFNWIINIYRETFVNLCIIYDTEHVTLPRAVC